MYDKDLQKFETHCAKCIFSTCDNGVQTGCEHDRLDMFKLKDRTRFQDGFYVIDGICNTCRWKKWEQANHGLNLLKAAKREAQIRLDIAIVNTNQETLNIQQLHKAVSDSVKQSIKPQHIIVATQHPDVNFRMLYQDLYEITEPYDIKLQVVRITDQDADISHCVNMALSKCNAQYAAVFNPNDTIPHNLIETFDNVINKQLQRVLMVNPKAGYSGLIIQLALFKQFGKNHNMPIFTKINETAELQKNSEATMTWEELWSQE